MKNKKKNTDTYHYILTFASIVLLISCFATHIITGNPALIILDSLSGSILIGSIFLCYLCWMIYDTSIAEQIEFSTTAVKILKSSTVAFCVYAYWIVFVGIPLLINLL